MRKWRVLSCVALACIICLRVCGVAYGAEWVSIDDMGIDPWGDIEAIEGQKTGNEGHMSFDDTVYTVSPDVGIMPLALADGEYTLRITPANSGQKAVQFYGIGSSYSSHVAQLDNGFTAFSSVTADGPDNIEAYIAWYNQSSYSVTSYISVLASKTSKIYLNGSFSAYPQMRIVSGSTETLRSLNGSYFNCQLLVNGAPYGEKQAGDALTFSNYEIDLSETGDISSIGIAVYCLSENTITSTGQNSFIPYQTAKAGWYVSDRFQVVEDGVSSGGVDEETKGILRTILDRITNLPAMIAISIKDYLYALFVPTQTDLTDLKTKYETLLSERLGFVWQAGDWILSFGQSILSALKSTSAYTFNFPGISVDLPEGTFVFVPAQVVNFDFPGMTFFRDTAGTAVALICVIAFLRTCERMLIAIISGVSYFEFLKGGHDDDS